VRLRTGNGTAVVESTTTIAGGAYTLDSVQVGEYNTNVSAAGYETATSAEFAITVNTPNPDTRNIRMTPVVLVTVSGYVTDSSTGAAIVGATVYLENGATVVDSTTTITGGAYTLTGVEAGDYNLVISMVGYGTKTEALVVGDVNINGENVQLAEKTAVLPVAASGNRAKPDFNLTATGVLHLVNFTRGGLITMFSVDGKLVYRRTFDAQENLVALPHGIVHSGSAYIVSITQDKAIYSKKVMLY
jgi:hypothetical protein